MDTFYSFSPGGQATSGITGPTGPGAKKPLTLKTFSGGEGNSQGGSGGQLVPFDSMHMFSLPQEYLDLTKVNFGKTKKKVKNPEALKNITRILCYYVLLILCWTFWVPRFAGWLWPLASLHVSWSGTTWLRKKLFRHGNQTWRFLAGKIIEVHGIFFAGSDVWLPEGNRTDSGIYNMCMCIYIYIYECVCIYIYMCVCARDNASDNTSII